MRRAIALIAVLALAGCALPRGAALEKEILQAKDDSHATKAYFRVVPVTRRTLHAFADWPKTGIVSAAPWPAHGHGSRERIVRAGDTLDLAIWDGLEAPLLGRDGDRVTRLPDLRVSPGGTIFVPYAGRIHVAGLTPEAARARLERQLEDIVPDVQVQLSLREGRGNSVDLIGGVARPGTFPMPDNAWRVLGLIAAGGGPRADLPNPRVVLLRGHHRYAIPFETLTADPKRNAILRGGDQVLLEADTRVFVSLGATGIEQRHPFPAERLSAIEAIAIAGGLQETRADPEGVLILREYPVEAAHGPVGPGHARVVFTIDLTSADGLFSARSFPIAPGDLVVATESPITDTQTILGLIGGTLGIAAGLNAL